ncbi:MAG: type II secretion system minor pseudopilin GspK, partial [Bacillota bacterium]
MKLERGVAAITAVLIVAVAASAAAFMLAQQSAMVDQATLVASRAQAERYGEAGLDWARGVLMADAQRAGAIDSLDEPWAQPIVGMPIERAIVAGAIVDEQGKFNLNNLVLNKQRSAADVKIFAALLESLGLAPELADPVVDWIDPDSDMSPAGAEDSYYLSLAHPYRAANQNMMQVEELYRIRGFDAATVAKLRPFV